MEATGAASHEVIHVGDNPEHDVAGAQSVGMYTVWMNAAGASWPGGEPADEEIADLAELPEAVTRIDQRAKLREIR